MNLSPAPMSSTLTPLPSSVPSFPLVVVGASAGGVESLQSLVSQLPNDFPAAVLVVLHLSAHGPSHLPHILSRAGVLPAQHPSDGQILEPGHLYIAPPDHHLLVDGPRMAVRRGPRENRHRPSVDALFRSAAYTAGPRVIGIVLSGMLDDGTSGLWTVKRLGGTALVQDPESALFPDMPRNALEAVSVDYCLPLEALGPLLVRLTAQQPARPTTIFQGQPTEKPTARHAAQQSDEVFVKPPDLPDSPLPDSHSSAPETPDFESRERSLLELEVRIAAGDYTFESGLLTLCEPSPLTCPECHGTLLKLQDGSRVRYRCHTGHAYSLSSLLSGVSESVEKTLWQTVRVLEEATLLFEHMVGHLENIGSYEQARQMRVQAQLERARAEAVQRLVVGVAHDVSGD